MSASQTSLLQSQETGELIQKSVARLMDKSEAGRRSVTSVKDEEPETSGGELQSGIPSRIGSQTERLNKRKKHRKAKHRGHKHHKHHKKEWPVFSYEAVKGIGKVVIGEDIQRLLKCLVGEHVTAEKPWTRVLKNFIQEQVDSEEVLPEWETFLKYKDQIIEFPGDDMMIGYIPDETRDYDEFYLCLNTDAEEKVNEINEKAAEYQQKRFENSINKSVGKWKSKGSDKEINEMMLKPTRGFYTVEFEAKYPIICSAVKFKLRLVKDARDGYLELKVPPRNFVQFISRKRIPRSIQAAPVQVENVAQTFCTYPTNSWTQYEYECQFVHDITKEFLEVFKKFTNLKMPDIDNHLYINSFINFYTNDYKDLIRVHGKHIPYGEFKEYQSLVDVYKCKDKMISAICWHPMWTGVIAIAYANNSPKWFNFKERQGKMMDEIAHGFNPILLWSFDDSLTPKLILETIAEVHCLAFCPQDPNILVGGCRNGQVVLWDIKNKLNKVEFEDVLTSSQQYYKTRLFAAMSWMKNTRNYSIVPPTAVSQLSYSHLWNITSITWLHPLYSVEKSGHAVPISSEQDFSMQFVTSSSDGSIKFWDLKQKPVILAGDYKPQKRSKKLAKRPSVLTMDVSPYRTLNRRLLPHYQLNIGYNEIDKPCPLGCLALGTSGISYRETNPDPNRVFNITDRIIYEPILQWPAQPLETKVVVGTYMGEIMMCTWVGFEYTSSELCTIEEPKVFNTAKYHDGPILQIEKHPQLNDVFMTVGGKVFAIWKESLKGKPILWRRARHLYTYGSWGTANLIGLRVNRADGCREIWNLDVRSDVADIVHVFSGKPIFEAIRHPLPLKTSVMGLADDRGTLRMVYALPPAPQNEETFRKIDKFIGTCEQRHNEFAKWQADWNEKNAARILEQHAAEVAETQRKHEEELNRTAIEEEMRVREMREAARRAAAKLKPPPGRYNEWAHERWIENEQERMGMELLVKKRLDKKTLVVQQEPLKKIEEDAARKQQKIKGRLEKMDEKFEETVAMLFPNLTIGLRKDAEDDSKSVHSEGEIEFMNRNFIDAYDYSIEDYNALIERNPFVYEFDWKKILESSKNRKQIRDFKGLLRHSDRHKSFLNRRERIGSAQSSISEIIDLEAAEASKTDNYIADDDRFGIA